MHLPLKNHVKRIERWPYTQFHATSKCFKSTLYLLLWPTERCRLVLWSKRSFSFRVLSRRSTDRHVARTRPHPYSSWTVYNTYVKGNRRRNIATKLSTDNSFEMLWQIIKGNSVWYFKSSGKAKNKLPVGGRLWILFESIWLKIKVIVCTIIVAWNS